MLDSGDRLGAGAETSGQSPEQPLMKRRNTPIDSIPSDTKIKKEDVVSHLKSCGESAYSSMRNLHGFNNFSYWWMPEQTCAHTQ